MPPKRKRQAELPLPAHLRALEAQFLVLEAVWVFLGRSKQRQSVGNLERVSASLQTPLTQLQIRVLAAASAGAVALEVRREEQLHDDMPAPEPYVAVVLTPGGFGGKTTERRTRAFREALVMLVWAAHGHRLPAADSWDEGFDLEGAVPEVQPCALPALPPPAAAGAAAAEVFAHVKGKLDLEQLRRGEVLGFFDAVAAAEWYQGQLCHVERIPAREARFGQLERPLHPTVARLLAARGISRLWSHQTEAMNAIRRGMDVVVATATSSGKSLCYSVPVLEAIVEDEGACALYMFPTKALAQDQLRAMQELSGPAGVHVGVFDGDSDFASRAAVMDGASIVLSNPDMLHVTLLPSHAQWERFLSKLRFVVIDEGHMYAGAFGSHVAVILRRLFRICRHYGSAPQFVMCSATIANAAEHAQRLLPCVALDRLAIVSECGAPSGEKLFAVWNPPMMASTSDEAAQERAEGGGQAALQGTEDLRDFAEPTTERRSSIKEVSLLLTLLVRHGFKTLAFAKVRRLAEIVLQTARDSLRTTLPGLVDKVCCYRGGYDKANRREIEQQLFRGELLGVATTNALELGVDIGDLDAVLLLGVPTSISSLWQQSGRAGRGVRPAVAAVVCFDSPLDQYFARHATRLFHRQVESVTLHPHNEHVLQQHLECAARELSLAVPHPDASEEVQARWALDAELFGERYQELVQELYSSGRLDPSSAAGSLGLLDLHPSLASPARRVNIRVIYNETVVVRDESTGEELDSTAWDRAMFELYAGAVYMNQGRSYIVQELDLEALVATVRRKRVDYFTKTRDYTDITTIRRERSDGRLHFGRVHVMTKVYGFKKVRLSTRRTFAVEDLVMPDIEFTTYAVWVDIHPDVKSEVEARGWNFLGGVHAAQHLLCAVLPLFVACDPADLRTGHPSPLQQREGPLRLIVVDARPNGAGIAATAFPHLAELLQIARDILEGCACAKGCPSCVLDMRCPEGNFGLDKAAAGYLLGSVTHSLASV